MWNVVCTEDWLDPTSSTQWRVGEGFTADRCSSQNWPDGSSFITGRDIDGHQFKVPFTHFKATKARWRTAATTHDI